MPLATHTRRASVSDADSCRSRDRWKRSYSLLGNRRHSVLYFMVRPFKRVSVYRYYISFQYGRPAVFPETKKDPANVGSIITYEKPPAIARTADPPRALAAWPPSPWTCLPPPRPRPDGPGRHVARARPGRRKGNGNGPGPGNASGVDDRPPLVILANPRRGHKKSAPRIYGHRGHLEEDAENRSCQSGRPDRRPKQDSSSAQMKSGNRAISLSHFTYIPGKHLGAILGPASGQRCWQASLPATARPWPIAYGCQCRKPLRPSVAVVRRKSSIFLKKNTPHRWRSQ